MQSKRYEILNGLPPYGPMYISISEDGVPFHFQGYVVLFYRSDGTNWVANFKTGNTNFNTIYDFPEFKRTIVFAAGNGYIMADDEENPVKAIEAAFTKVFIADNNILIAADQTDFTVINISTDEVWRSGRISWDGFDNLNLSGDFIIGLAYEPTSGDGRWEPFSFNYKTNEIIDRKYEFKSNTKPWWKIW